MNKIKEMVLRKNSKNITGQRFGRLVVLYPTEERRRRRVVWYCICDCGNNHKACSDCLRGGHVKSCGCLQKIRAAEAQTKHKMCGTPTYNSWAGMLTRCKNSNQKHYKYYGGRGISVCERWHTFENFYEDMGNRPKGKSLDRWPDGDGNYEPGNTRWATQKQQVNNSRKLYWFFAFNKNLGILEKNNNQTDFAKQWGLERRSISACLCNKQKDHRGWTFQRI